MFHQIILNLIGEYFVHFVKKIFWIKNKCHCHETQRESSWRSCHFYLPHLVNLTKPPFAQTKDKKTALLFKNFSYFKCFCFLNCFNWPYFCFIQLSKVLTNFHSTWEILKATIIGYLDFFLIYFQLILLHRPLLYSESNPIKYHFLNVASLIAE